MASKVFLVPVSCKAAQMWVIWGIQEVKEEAGICSWLPMGIWQGSLHGSLDRQLEVLVHSPFLSFLLEEQVKVELCFFQGCCSD